MTEAETRQDAEKIWGRFAKAWNLRVRFYCLATARDCDVIVIVIKTWTYEGQRQDVINALNLRRTSDKEIGATMIQVSRLLLCAKK